MSAMTSWTEVMLAAESSRWYSRSLSSPRSFLQAPTDTGTRIDTIRIFRALSGTIAFSSACTSVLSLCGVRAFVRALRGTRLSSTPIRNKGVTCAVSTLIGRRALGEHSFGHPLARSTLLHSNWWPPRPLSKDSLRATAQRPHPSSAAATPPTAVTWGGKDQS